MRPIITLMLGLSFAWTGEAPVLLVAPFENLSGVREVVDYELSAVSSATVTDAGKAATGVEAKKVVRVDRLSDAPRSMLEDKVVGMGGRVVERQRLDALMQEADFVRVSGLANPGDAVRWGKLAGAKTIIVGTVNQIRTQTKSFQGYGVTTQRTIVSSEVRVRMVDVETGEIRLSKTVVGEQERLDTGSARSTDSDVAYSVIKDAIAKLAEDKDFIARVKGEPSK